MKALCLMLGLLVLGSNVKACIWDAESMWREKLRSHSLAKTILEEPPKPDNQDDLRAKIKELESSPKKNDPEWWNNLAGAYLRLNEPEAAVKLLSPVIAQFPNDYGMHANLGTAYHLLGKYAEAEKEIARDLEINSEAHFGLEKYHLALLQYLVRDKKYQSRHLYVDELTYSLESRNWGHFYFSDSDEQSARQATKSYNSEAAAEAEFQSVFKTNAIDDRIYGDMLGTLAAFDPIPSYRSKWNLGVDTNLEQGVIYMAQLNPKEPACAEMLGMVAWKQKEYHLAVKAFEKANELGSSKADLLKLKIGQLNDYIRRSPPLNADEGVTIVICIMMSLVLYYIVSKTVAKSRLRKNLANS